MPRNPDIDSCYLVLGVRNGATQDELKQAYYDLVREWHPDRHQHDSGKQKIAEERLKEINVAYERLKSHNPQAAPRVNGNGRSAAKRNGYTAYGSGWRQGTTATRPPVEEPDEAALFARAQALYDEGASRFAEGEWTEAVSSLTQAVCIKPNIGDGYWLLGRSYSELKMPAKAASAYKQVLRFQPDRVEAHDGLAQSYLAMGAPKDAVWTCSQILKRRPKATGVRTTLGRAYRKLGQLNQSLEAITGALEQDSGFAPARYELGETYLALGRKEEAREVYAELKLVDADLAVQLLLSIVGTRK